MNLDLKLLISHITVTCMGVCLYALVQLVSSFMLCVPYDLLEHEHQSGVKVVLSTCSCPVLLGMEEVYAPISHVAY